MSTIKTIVQNKGVVVFQGTDVNGRQELEVKGLAGETLWRGRRLKGLINFLKGVNRTPFVFDDLPRRAKERIKEWCAENRKQCRAYNHHRPATLGDVWPRGES